MYYVHTHKLTCLASISCVPWYTSTSERICSSICTCATILAWVTSAFIHIFVTKRTRPFIFANAVITHDAISIHYLQKKNKIEHRSYTQRKWFSDKRFLSLTSYLLYKHVVTKANNFATRSTAFDRQTKT